MKNQMNTRCRRYFWASLSLLLISISAGIGVAYADVTAAKDITGIVSNVTQSFGAMAKLITAIAYIAGLGFAVGAIFKFKAHKDNPTQIPIGTPIALLFVGAALVFMPNVFTATGQTVFGNTSAVGGASGKDPFASGGT